MREGSWRGGCEGGTKEGGCEGLTKGGTEVRGTGGERRLRVVCKAIGRTYWYLFQCIDLSQ